MKSFKILALVSLLTLGITTSAFASWWNPFTWHFFTKKVVSVQPVQEVQLVQPNPVPQSPVVEPIKTPVASSTSNVATTTESKLKTYTDDKYGFSVSYNPSLFKTNGEGGYMGVPNYKNTLFSLFYELGNLTIRGDRTTTYEDCLRNTENTKKVKPVEINGVTFYKSGSGDAALGHYLSVDNYRTYHNGACYEIHVWVETDRDNSGNLVNTKPVTNELEKVLNTFMFTTAETALVLHTGPQSDIKVFTGTKIPVSFSHPSTHVVFESESAASLSIGSKVGLDLVSSESFEGNISVQKGYEGKNEDIKSQMQKSMKTDPMAGRESVYTQTSIGGEDAYISGDINKSSVIYVQHGSSYYRIIFFGPFSGNMYKQFLESFRFLD